MLGSPVTFNGITINNRAAQPTLHAESPFYYIMLKNVDGLRTADISYESNPIPNAPGEKSGDVFRRGKTVTLSGFVYGRSLQYLETGCDVLQQMFAPLSQGPISWTRLSDGVAVYLDVKVNQDLSIVEQIDDFTHRYAWVVGLRADIPFTRAVSGGAIYPAWQQ